MSFLVPFTRQQVEQNLVTEFVEELQSNNPNAAVPNTGKGSTMGAAFRAESLQFVQNQNNLTQVANRSRLTSSQGQDVDSYVNAHGVYRNGSAPASGSVTFSTASIPGADIIIPIGTIVQTPGGVQFTVVADNSQTGYNATKGGYVIPAGTNPPNVNASVVCTTPGSIGNVLANQITVIYGGGGPLPPVQNVTNAQAFTNGSDQEQDTPLKSRFTTTVAGQRSGTTAAILAAAQAVQSGLTITVGDMINALGQSNQAPSTTTTAAVTPPAVGSTVSVPVSNINAIPLGSTVAVYDGTHAFVGLVTSVGTSALTVQNQATVASGIVASGGTVLFVGPTALFTVVVNVLGQASGPSASLIAAVTSAVAAVKPAGCVFGVIAPTLVAVNSSATIHVSANTDQNALTTALTTAYDNFLNNFGLDPAGKSLTCAYFDIAMVLRQVTGVNRVDSLTVNSGTADIVATFGQQIVAGTLTLTFATP